MLVFLKLLSSKTSLIAPILPSIMSDGPIISIPASACDKAILHKIGSDWSLSISPLITSPS